MLLPRTRHELERELIEQGAALRASCAAYDRGVLWEAKRIASVLYILLHDGMGRTRSLLTQLGGRDCFEYFTAIHPSAPPTPGYMPLIMARTGAGTPTCVAIGEEGLNFSWARFVPFKTWWEETIFTSISGERFSRASLVLSIRDQDGGSHYDGTLNNPTYLEFKAFDAIKAFQIAGLPAPIDHAGNPIESLPNAHTAMIRQIAWEVGYSLDLAVKEKGSLSMVF